MNKKVLVIVVALMAVAMLTASVNTALAETVYTEHVYAGVNCIVDVPNQTMIRLIVYGDMYGDFYSGKADRIQISVHTGQYQSGLPVFKAVAAYEDNPTRNAFSVGLGTPQVQNLVEPGQIQVLRVGKTNTVMLHWNVPLICPATGGSNPTPEVTLPPGKLVLRGYGEAISGGSSALINIGSTGWKYSVPAWSYYKAAATLFCESWNYKWLPVAEDYIGTTMEPRSIAGQDWTWWHE